ncbi:MAG TPA: PAS domain S-box protein [Methanomicrobiales archaeon]|nr:PAS domain S-box protein [Methanomicrobiales archaeon]
MAGKVPLSRSATGRRLDAMARRGDIHIQTYGKTRVFSIPRRASLDSTMGRPPPLVLVLSGKLHVLDVNGPLLSTFRFQREELQGRPLGRTPLARCAGEGFLGAVRKAAEGGAAGTAEFECLIGESLHAFRAGILPLAPRRGGAGMVVSLEDVTGSSLHRRSLEENLDEETLGLLSSNPSLLREILERKREEEQMQVVRLSVDRARVPALWVARDGHFLRVNQAAAAILGYTEEELARMSLPELDLDHPPGSWESLWEAIRAQSATSFDGRFRTKAGGAIRVEVRASHLAHRDQEFAFLILEDATRRREAEDALRGSEAALRTFLDANPDPSFLVDNGGRILLANRAGAALLGREMETLPGTSIFDAMPEKAEAAREALRRVRETGRAGVFAEEILGRYFHTVLSPLVNASAEVDRVAIFARDISDRKRVEDALRYANEKLNLLTAITRHDVLNDIAALGMYLELPETSGAPGPSPALAGRLTPLVASLRRRMEFTRDYADLGMKMPGWEDVSGAVVRAVAGRDLGGVRVENDLPALEVYADPLFERVIENLADNSLRHGEHTASLRFSARMEGDSCIMVVEDDGVGIPVGKKEAIFRAGYGKHTGLGLFLIREILGITGMSISETGEPGKGARFEIRIPPGGFRMKDGSGVTNGNCCIQA